MRFLVSLAAGLLASTSLAGADDLPGDPVAGLDFARGLCIECHVIEPDQETLPDIGAPTFQELADEPSVTAIGLRFLLQKPHDRMPDLLLTPQQTDDVISYILTLKPR
ncbi:MAG: hypothetical protein MI824_26650 [Hyphomicrobiales bacterium]|nr:hypothetical protein [Hyphomicrobiales bacterium]